MTTITNLNQNKSTLLYWLSRLFERGAYYGSRTLIVLYLTSETMKMSSAETLSILGYFTIGIAVSSIIGAIIGDLLFSNKKILIIGGLFQVFGSILLCFSNVIILYVALGLIIIGTGFYTPNLKSLFGKQNLRKPNLLDSSFTLLYIATNLGSFFGIMLIGFVGDKYSFKYGFILSALLYGTSIIFSTYTEKEKNQFESKHKKMTSKFIKICLAILFTSFFWWLYAISDFNMNDIQKYLIELDIPHIDLKFWSSLNFIFILSIGVIFLFTWSKYHINSFAKIALGFLFGAIGFVMLLFIPFEIEEQHALYLVITFLCFSIAELFIAPILNSILTFYSNPKYLAILFSLAYIPSKLIIGLFSLCDDELYEDSILGLKVGLILSITLFVIVFLYSRKIKQYNNSTELQEWLNN